MHRNTVPSPHSPHADHRRGDIRQSEDDPRRRWWLAKYEAMAADGKRLFGACK